MVVVNELLGVKKLKIYQNKDMFSFSIDSLLLASFSSVTNKTLDICDLCCGNAPVSLYMSLRTSAKITGVEIQEEIYKLGVLSVKENKLEEQINLINDNLININKKIKKKFDLVVCNPPYFKYSPNSNLNKNDYLSIARHEIHVTLDDICKEANILLKDNGYFTLVHRPDRLSEIICTLKKYNLEPKRMQFVYPKKGSSCNHVLIESRKTKNSNGLKVLKPLFIHNSDGSYKKEILDIFNYNKKI